MNMREIEFRAWDKRFERYVADPANIRLNIATGETHGKYSGGNVNDWELEQYTGLKLKNIKMFAGDLVYVAGIGTLEVYYDECLLLFAFKDENNNVYDYQDIIEDIEEIIGNIHQS